MRDARMLLLCLGAAALGAGCRGRGEAGALELSGEPVGVQMMRVEPHLKTQRFNTLVSFESPSDTVFVTPVGGKVERSAQVAHTGRHALRTDADELRLKLVSLVPKGTFPGKWTLLGGYVYAPDGAQVTVAQRKIAVPKRRWTPVFVDVSSANAAPAYAVRVESSSPVWFDDFMLVDNALDIFVD